jgi:lysyl-tRNA synthetase class 2
MKIRKRYLDIVTNNDVKNVFLTRTKVISTIRNFLNNNDFLEVETPILQTEACGAQARPFVTHHHAFDTDLYLRIAPETYLKRAIAASFDRVYEIGKNFRNEGLDPTHMQEFTSLEFYAAYWDYEDNLNFFQKMLPEILSVSGHHDGLVEYQNVKLDFNTIRIDTYDNVFRQYTGISPLDCDSAKQIDEMFKAKVRPNLIQPIYIKDYPAHMSPLAHRTSDGQYCEQWQFVVNSAELVKCYTEMTDPILQRSLLEEQASMRLSGDDEAMMLEESFLQCMEYGIPHCSGLGLGIDRFVALMTNQTTLRNVILFPTVL